MTDEAENNREDIRTLFRKMDKITEEKEQIHDDLHALTLAINNINTNGNSSGESEAIKRIGFWATVVPVVLSILVLFYNGSTALHTIGENQKNVEGAVDAIKSIQKEMTVNQAEHAKFHAYIETSQKMSQDRYKHLYEAIERLDRYWQEYGRSIHTHNGSQPTNSGGLIRNED